MFLEIVQFKQNMYVSRQGSQVTSELRSVILNIVGSLLYITSHYASFDLVCLRREKQVACGYTSFLSTYYVGIVIIIFLSVDLSFKVLSPFLLLHTFNAHSRGHFSGSTVDRKVCEINAIQIEKRKRRRNNGITFDFVLLQL